MHQDHDEQNYGAVNNSITQVSNPKASHVCARTQVIIRLRQPETAYADQQKQI